MKGPEARGAEGLFHIYKMLTPTHIAFSLLIYFVLIKLGFIGFTIPLLIFLLCAELIDLDHLFSKPIYVRGRNSFKTHFIHKHYFWVLGVSILLMFFKPVFTIGLGLICHLFLDLIYVFVYKKS
jgi:hypothetical protein